MGKRYCTGNIQSKLNRFSEIQGWVVKGCCKRIDKAGLFFCTKNIKGFENHVEICLKNTVFTYYSIYRKTQVLKGLGSRKSRIMKIIMKIYI